MLGRVLSAPTLAMVMFAVATVLIDQTSKAVARTELIAGQPVSVLRGLLDLSLSFNTGAAFGIMPNSAPLLIVVGLVLIYAIVRLRDVGRERAGLRFGLGILLGGAVGNLVDRILPPHTVTDFISLKLTVAGQAHPWPTFNLADVAIVAGVLAVMLGMHRTGRGETSQ
jgi:signal peptidase II